MSGNAKPVRWSAAPSSTGTGRSSGSSSGLCKICCIGPLLRAGGFGLVLSASVRDEFHQRPVGIAEIDAGALPFRAEALHRPALDRDGMGGEMRDRLGDRALPFEADVAVAGL